MNNTESFSARWRHTLSLGFFRFAASGMVPAQWFQPVLPAVENRAARRGKLNIEIVSHCWEYSRFLAYQLSSLTIFPPRQSTVTMTVFYSKEDTRTASLLDYFGKMNIPNIQWNWWALSKERLFRRAIGRNMAAHITRADWIWFTDCDVLFREGCLDGLAEVLQGRRDALVFPHHERVTPLLAEDDPLLANGNRQSWIQDIDPEPFILRELTRATGPLQITHGDVARACGYCDSLKIYQQPADHWCKAHEDRAFRWLLRTQGVALEIPGVYRIRHAAKGRYGADSLQSRIRGTLRRIQSRLRDRRSR